MISPALVAHLKLTQPQLTTIALAYAPRLFFFSRLLITPTYSGMMGQYSIVAFVGKLLDYYGAWACSLIAACFFSAGFGLFANEIANTPDTITQPSISTFYNLVICFFIAAVGTVFSYVHILLPYTNADMGW